MQPTAGRSDASLYPYERHSQLARWLILVSLGLMELNQVTLPAVDVAASVAFYRKMGFELIVEAPHYARFKSPVGNATFSVHAVDAMVEPPKTIVYFECSSLDQQVDVLKSSGLHFAQDPRDEPWLWREARLVDPAWEYHLPLPRWREPPESSLAR